MNAKDIEPYPRDHYQRMGYDRVRDEVVRLDSNNKILSMAGGPEISYDRLLIASGSVPRMMDWPGKDLDGVGNFVTWQHLEWMQEKAKTAKRACVVGGGLIGVESAEILLKAGLKVSFIIREDWYWPIALDKDEGTMISDHMKYHGCDIQLKTTCEEIVGKNGKVVGIRTGDSRIVDCDMVVFSIGVVPQTGWLSESGIEIDRSGGIVVGNHLETNLPDVWAAGDCTSVVWFNDVRRPEQLWYTSRDQGRVAGQNMAGDAQTYRIR
jgi:NAD(P)H-nitrite reductase large subunit